MGLQLQIARHLHDLYGTGDGTHGRYGHVGHAKLPALSQGVSIRVTDATDMSTAASPSIHSAPENISERVLRAADMSMVAMPSLRCVLATARDVM